MRLNRLGPTNPFLCMKLHYVLFSRANGQYDQPSGFNPATSKQYTNNSRYINNFKSIHHLQKKKERTTTTTKIDCILK